MHVGEPKRQDPLFRRVDYTDLRSDIGASRQTLADRSRAGTGGLWADQQAGKPPEKMTITAFKAAYIILCLIIAAAAGYLGGW